MHITDVRTKTEDELKKTLGELAKEAFNLRFQKANGQVENPSRARFVRRDMARIKTAIKERALGLEYAATERKAAAKPKKAAKKKAS